MAENTVVYISKSGNTKKIADAIAKGAQTKAQPITPDLKLENINTLFIGGGIYAGKIDKKLREFVGSIDSSKVKQVVVFTTSAAGKKTIQAEVKSILQPKGIKVSDKAFICKGSFLLANRGKPDQEDQKAAETFGKNILLRIN